MVNKINMVKIFNYLKNKLSKKGKNWYSSGEHKYYFQFTIKYPFNNGTETTTGVINITVTAENEDEAEDKLLRYVRQRISINVKKKQKQ